MIQISHLKVGDVAFTVYIIMKAQLWVSWVNIKPAYLLSTLEGQDMSRIQVKVKVHSLWHALATRNHLTGGHDPLHETK